jgi:hypothetical protein
MKRSEIKKMPEYYDRYINLCDDVAVTAALAIYGSPMFQKEKQALLQLGDNVYAPGKWTVKDTIQHIIDTERVFAYRAMRISRGDTTPLPGFDENMYAEHTTAATRTLEDLMEEFDVVRRSTILLYKSSTDGMLQNEGTASGKTISPLAIGFTIAGHAIHHMNVLRERYYPLIK